MNVLDILNQKVVEGDSLTSGFMSQTKWCKQAVFQQNQIFGLEVKRN